MPGSLRDELVFSGWLKSESIQQEIWAKDAEESINPWDMSFYLREIEAGPKSPGDGRVAYVGRGY